MGAIFDEISQIYSIKQGTRIRIVAIIEVQ